MKISKLFAIYGINVFVLNLFGNLTIIAGASPSVSVYFKEDGAYVHVYHPNLYVRIAKLRGTYLSGGRIDAATFKGKPIVYTSDPGFGSIRILNASDVAQIQSMYASHMALVSATGNNTNKLILIFATQSITLYDGTGALPVNVTSEFTFYADIDNIFIWITLNSTLNTWRISSISYGQSLRLNYFENYEVKGTRNTVIGQGNLTGTSSQDFVFVANYPQITVKNTTNNVAVTMFPLSLFPSTAWLRDRPSYTWIFFETSGSRTYDGSWFTWGQNIRDITYGTGIAFHDADASPQVITPWLMPNAVPYGIMHSYDELPHDSYRKVQPDPTTDTYTFWQWHELNPKARINLMLGLDMLADGYTRTEGGVDGTWAVHGNHRLVNASGEWKNWLKSIEGTWIGYGIHAYHHDYPWVHEFSTVTNMTWIDATWNQITEDIHAIGLKNQIWFKAPWYKMRPQGLDILIRYGIKGYNVNYEEPPEATALYFHVDSEGRKLILFSNSLSADDELNRGKSPSYVYNNLIKGNLTKLGLLSMSGHFINQSIYAQWDELFDLIDAEFDFDYFLVEEIIDYWYNVLLPLKYTYNSTTITKNINDTRLTFKLTDSHIQVNSGLKYVDDTFVLYSPDFTTANVLFTRATGYANYTNIHSTQDTLTFTVSAPSGTTSTTKIHCGSNDKPERLEINNIEFNEGSCWTYNYSTKILTIELVHSGPLTVLIHWASKVTPSPDSQLPMCTIVLVCLALVPVIWWFIRKKRKLKSKIE